MNKLNAVIIDDEENARENLAGLLRDFCPEVYVQSLAGSVKEGIKAINEYKPDILFLDIKMQGETGFDLLDDLEEKDFSLVFTTAYDEYALKAFKFNAIDYLLKPINIEELTKAVNKIAKNKSHSKFEQIESVLREYKRTNNQVNKIALPTSEGLLFIDIQDIIRCESSDNYTKFYLINGERIIVSKTIKYYDAFLSDHNFLRVHQSHLINLAHIKKYYKGDGGYALMSDGSTVIVSRRKKDVFIKKFMNR